MEHINKNLQKYGPGHTEKQVEKNIQEIFSGTGGGASKDLIRKLFSLIDLTTLSTNDTAETARYFCNNVNSLGSVFPDMPNVAAICVYPTLVEAVKKNLKVEGIKIASVGAGFPSSQTFLSVKLAECQLLVEKGADEIDIVMSVGQFLDGEYQLVFDEINLIKSTIGKVHLKVILETGLLGNLENIRLASFIAMEAGADFIKTSTGKLSPAATPEAVYVMLNAIRDFNDRTGKKVGIKPAGGIANLEDALSYFRLVDHVLGSSWTKPGLFRIGASRLANNLLSALYDKPVQHF
jgi:deoxyribose-phosphate aldolase